MGRNEKAPLGAFFISGDEFTGNSFDLVKIDKPLSLRGRIDVQEFQKVLCALFCLREALSKLQFLV